MRIRFFSLPALVGLAVFTTPAFSATAEKTRDDRVVKAGMMVSLEYTLKNPEGKTLESSKGKEPLKYIHGQKMMIPGLERELTGMKVGGEKHVTVKPEDGYGKIDPRAVQEFPKEKIPENALKVGAVLAARSPEGMVVPMTVRQIKENTVVMDLNHPMAGKTLVFDVKVIDIQPAPKPTAPPAKSTVPAKPAAPAQPNKPAESTPKK
jgi:FKBP-type peptidyl-prolyl cis-trans isomerase SlyD